MLWIQNVTPRNRPADQPDDYVIRINRRELARFQHFHADGAAACFRAAADALDAAGSDDEWRRKMAEAAAELE